MEKSLFEIPITHRNDPKASMEGAKYINHKKRQSQCDMILDCLRANPDLTSGEIATMLNLTYYQVQKRITDLQNLCQVVYVGYRKCRIRGTICGIWRLPNQPY